MHTCCMHREQKMVSGDLFYLFPAIPLHRLPQLLDSYVLSQAGRQQVPVILLSPVDTLGLGSEVCTRCLACYVGAGVHMIVQEALATMSHLCSFHSKVLRQGPTLILKTTGWLASTQAPPSPAFSVAGLENRQPHPPLVQWIRI